MDTYEGKDGKRYTIPEPQNDVADLFAHIREQLSPDAVAVIAYRLHFATTCNGNVQNEIMWFKDELADMLGGWDRVNQMVQDQEANRIGERGRKS